MLGQGQEATLEWLARQWGDRWMIEQEVSDVC